MTVRYIRVLKLFCWVFYFSADQIILSLCILLLCRKILQFIHQIFHWEPSFCGIPNRIYRCLFIVLLREVWLGDMFLSWIVIFMFHYYYYYSWFAIKDGKTFCMSPWTNFSIYTWPVTEELNLTWFVDRTNLLCVILQFWICTHPGV